MRDAEQLAGGLPGAELPAGLMRAPSSDDLEDRLETAYDLKKLRQQDRNGGRTSRSIDMPRSNRYKKIEKNNPVREESGE